MASLEHAQSNFITTINDGPKALNRELFAGPIDRVVLGLKAHANTISHARLVALEETFPLTRSALGHDAFSWLSRDYTETTKARCCDSNAIGGPFMAFMREAGIDPAIAELAAIEWAWLESYHSADARALEIADIAGMDEGSLLALRVTAHPAARAVMLSAPLAEQLADVAAILPNPATILAVRPEAEVRLVPLDAAATALFSAAIKSATIGNLLALAAEQPDMTDPSGPMMILLGAGALMENRDAGNDSPL